MDICLNLKMCCGLCWPDFIFKGHFIFGTDWKLSQGFMLTLQERMTEGTHYTG